MYYLLWVATMENYVVQTTVPQMFENCSFNFQLISVIFLFDNNFKSDH